MITVLRDKILPIIDTDKVYKVMTSHASLVIQACMAAVFFHLKLPIASLLFFGILLIIALWFSRDMMPCFAPLMFVSMSLLNMYGTFIDDFLGLWPIVLFIIIGLAARPFVYREKYREGKMLFAIIGVAISVTIGGLGAISIVEYFKPVSLYYVGMLGIGIVISYLYMKHYVNINSRFNAMAVLTKSMLYIGLLGVLMVLPYAIMSIADSGVVVYAQWKNNISTFLLLSMPFAFYYAAKVEKLGFIYYIFGMLQYASLMLIQSRGGMLFGTLILVICMVTNIVFNTKHNRIASSLLLACIIIAAITIMSIHWREVLEYIGIIGIDSDEARIKLFGVAIENFKNFPIFGTGLGYVGEFFDPAKGGMYWYHSTPFQVLGSLGTVGVVAYLYQLYVRLRVCAGKFTQFNLYGFVSFAAFELMALVNPGDFSPIPFVVGLTLILTVMEQGNHSDKNNLYLRTIHEPPTNR